MAMGKKKREARERALAKAAAMPRTAAERAFMEEALAAYRATVEDLRRARDPSSSKAAYTAHWTRSDELAKKMLEEAEKDEEEPGGFADRQG